MFVVLSDQKKISVYVRVVYSSVIINTYGGKARKHGS